MHTARHQLAKDSVPSSNAFMRIPCPTKDQALASMSIVERRYFESVILLAPTKQLVEMIARYPQKTDPWKSARKGRMTGSTTAPAVGHKRDMRAIRFANQMSENSPAPPIESTEAMDWGSSKEYYAKQCLINDLNRAVVTAYRDQRQTHIKNASEAGADEPKETKEGVKEGVQRTVDHVSESAKHDWRQTFTHFTYRGSKIPVLKPHLDPVVEVRDYNLLIDSRNHWRGCSPDGVVWINGVAVGCLEIKCPYAQRKALYINVKTYYYDQIMCELYLCQLYWPTIQWLDKVVWSPDGWVVDSYSLDKEYFYEWYLPRETRFYFQLYLPLVAQYIRNHVMQAMQFNTIDRLMSKEPYEVALNKSLQDLYKWKHKKTQAVAVATAVVTA